MLAHDSSGWLLLSPIGNLVRQLGAEDGLDDAALRRGNDRSVSMLTAYDTRVVRNLQEQVKNGTYFCYAFGALKLRVELLESD